ncbi:MAG: 30S ribosome-binding factor RbfA [Desulfobacteraceae bacterium]|nr:30S ribosome-binding factor RbfA [Desulfobacteraceae bacterium]
MRPFSRADRVGGLIKQTLAELLLRQISDPRLTGAVITGVKVTGDLRLAKIYFSAPGGEKGHQEAKEGFEQAHGFIKRELAQRLGLRYMPDLRFYYDASIDYGARIEELLKTVKQRDEEDH